MKKSQDILWLRQLRDLERYCNSKGYRVVYKKIDIEAVYYEKKLIVMSTKTSDEIALYCLLHELGHVKLLDRDKKYRETYSYIFENFSKTSLTHRIAILQEELDAWREGLKLAESLQIYIDRRKWEITKTKCISTYLSWVKPKKTKKKDANKEPIHETNV